MGKTIIKDINTVETYDIVSPTTYLSNGKVFKTGNVVELRFYAAGIPSGSWVKIGSVPSNCYPAYDANRQAATGTCNDGSVSYVEQVQVISSTGEIKVYQSTGASRDITCGIVYITS